MKTLRVLFCITACLISFSLLSQELKKNDEDTAINEKVQELIKDKTDRADKVLSIFKFIRDEIAETKTKFG